MWNLHLDLTLLLLTLNKSKELFLPVLQAIIRL